MAGFTFLSVLAHARRQRWLKSLDRRFFREQYNAQEILRATLEQVSTASSLSEVAPRVVKEIEAAMHPLFCAILQLDGRAKSYNLVFTLRESRLHRLVAGVELSKLQR